MEQTTFLGLLKVTLHCAECERDRIRNGQPSKWNLILLDRVVIPELSQLLEYALAGEVYFKYGKSQRMLESTYYMTDSLKNLSDTALGKMLSKLQAVYNAL